MGIEVLVQSFNRDFTLKSNLIDQPIKGKYDAILLAVAHDEFKSLSLNQIKAFSKDSHVLYDLKYLLDANEVDGRL